MQGPHLSRGASRSSSHGRGAAAGLSKRFSSAAPPASQVARSFHAGTSDAPSHHDIDGVPGVARHNSADNRGPGRCMSCLQSHFGGVVLLVSLVFLIVTEQLKNASPGLVTCEEPSNYRPCIYTASPALSNLIQRGGAGAIVNGTPSVSLNSYSEAACVWNLCACPTGTGAPSVQSDSMPCADSADHGWDLCVLPLPMRTAEDGSDSCVYKPLVTSYNVEHGNMWQIASFANWVLGFGSALSSCLALLGRTMRQCGGGSFGGVGGDGEHGDKSACTDSCCGFDWFVPPAVWFFTLLSALDLGEASWWGALVCMTLIVGVEIAASVHSCCRSIGGHGGKRYVPRPNAVAPGGLWEPDTPNDASAHAGPRRGRGPVPGPLPSGYDGGESGHGYRRADHDGGGGGGHRYDPYAPEAAQGGPPVNPYVPQGGLGGHGHAPRSHASHGPPKRDF